MIRNTRLVRLGAARAIAGNSGSASIAAVLSCAVTGKRGVQQPVNSRVIAAIFSSLSVIVLLDFIGGVEADKLLGQLGGRRGRLDDGEQKCGDGAHQGVFFTTSLEVATARP